MAVNAKVKVERMERSEGYTRISFMPNYGEEGAKINEEWSYYTPSLDYHMNVRNEVADAHFDLGQAFTVTFTPDEG